MAQMIFCIFEDRNLFDVSLKKCFEFLTIPKGFNL